MQKELFAEQNEFLLTIVDSNTWIPHAENMSVKNVTIDYESYAYENAIPGFPTHATGPDILKYTTVEFNFFCDESKDILKFINNSFGYKPLLLKTCMIFRTGNKTYLVHDAVIAASAFNQDSTGRDYVSVQSKAAEVEIF